MIKLQEKIAWRYRLHTSRPRFDATTAADVWRKAIRNGEIKPVRPVK